MTSSAFDPANDNLVIHSRKEIVFIEDNVADIDTLIKGVGSGKEIVILDSTQDGLHQIAQTLAGRTGIDALHVIAHGLEGAANFGALQLNGANAGAHGADLKAIGSSMAAGGDILLYGCNIGAGADGAGFLQQLAIATGADVAASNNLTGSAALGGDWELEVASGSIETPVVVNAQTAALYQQVLGIASYNVDFHNQANFVVTSTDTSSASTDTIYRVNGNSAYQLVIDGRDVGTSAYAGTSSFTDFVSAAPNAGDRSVTIKFAAGQVFNATSISLANFYPGTQNLVIKGYDAAGNPVGGTATPALAYGQNAYAPVPIALTGMTGIASLKITATSNGNLVRYLIIDDLSLTNIQPPAPKVINVTSPNTNGTYKIGQTIDVQLNFDNAVDVTGTPQLTLETGTTDRVINYVSGSGTSSLTFRYTVQAGDTATDLDYKNTSIALNGGTIKLHANTADADLTLPNPGSFGSLMANKDIVVDGIAPTMTITSNKSLLGATGTANDTAIITFTFSEDPGATFTAADVSVSGGTLGPINGSSGLTRTATFSQGVNGTASISVAAGAYADAAGNTNLGASSLSLTVDTIAPVVAIASNKSVVKAGDTALITFTFSEDPGATFTWNGSSGDVAVSGGTLSAISGTGLTRTATFTPAAGQNGVAASITVNNNSYADIAGNPGSAGASPSITVDTVLPTVSVSSDKPALKVGETATITFTFSEDPGASFGASDITLNGGTLGAISGSGTTRTAIFTPNANTNSGSATISVNTASFQDAAGNSNSAGGSTSLTYDTKAPTLTIGSDKPGLKAGETATITFTFSENPGASFDDSDIAVSGGTLSAISGSGTTRTAIFTPAANVDAGTASISVAGVKYEDAKGNTGANASLSFGYDTQAPNAPAALVLDTGDDSGESNSDGITNKGAPTFSGTADPGTTIKLYDTDGVTQIGSGSADGGGIWHITTSTTLANGSHTIKAQAFDAAGNASPLASGPTVVIDTAPPTVAITSDKTVLKAGDTATITFSFSEDPGTSFGWDGSAGSVTVSGGTLSALSGSGAVRTATFTPSAGTDAGSAHISVAASTYHDLAGNDGGAGNLALTYDTLAPNKPSAPVLAAGDDSGSSNSDAVTSAGTLHLSGSADSGSTVKLYDGGTEIASVTASGGAYSFTLAGVAEGNHTYTALAVDAAGNESAASAGQLVVVDRTPPSTTVAGAALSADTGASATDMITSDGNQTISGTLSANLAAGERVMVSLDNGATWNQASAGAGTNTWQLAGVTLGGSSTLKVQVVDLAGNGGTAYAHAYTVDNVKPGAPSTPDLDAASDSGSSHTDDITGVTLPGFSGTAEIGATVRLFDGGVDIGSDVAVNGTWHITTSSSTPMSQRTHYITAIATDLAGNSSTSSLPLELKVLTSAPTTTVAGMALSVDSGAAGDFITNQTIQKLTGTLSSVLTAGERVEVSTDGGTSWTAAISAVGSDAWSDYIVLANGTHDIKVRVVDAVDNPGAVTTQAYTVDSIKPAVAVDSSASTLKAGETAVITFTFSEDPGTSFGSSDIVLSGGTLSALSGSGTVRTAIFTPDAGIDGGTASIAVKADAYEDLAGNLGTASVPRSLTFDTLAPGASSAPDLDKDSDKGASDTDNLTNQTSLVFKGTAEAGATVRLYDSNGTTEIGSGTASGGSWTIATSALTQGSHSVTAKVTDAAGNVGAVSGATVVTIDTTRPTLAIGSDVSQLKIGETAVITFTFSEDPGASFDSSDIALSGGTLSALSGSGAVRTAVFTPAANTNGGTGSVSVTGAWQDAAGNDGTSGAMLSLNVDTAAPAAPSAPVLRADNGISSSDNIVTDARLGFVVTAESGATVKLYDADSGVLLANMVPGGAGSWVTPPLAPMSEGPHRFYVTATDAAGNVSAPSAITTVTIDTIAPPDVTIGSNVSKLKIGETATITFTFSADPGADFSLANIAPTSAGSFGPLSGAGLTRTSVFTPYPDHDLDSAYIHLVDYHDAAGNAGKSGFVILNVDTKAPAAPSTPVLTAASDTGSSSSDRITSDTTPVFSGTKEMATTVTLYDSDGSVLGSVYQLIPEWSIKTPTLSEGTHTITAKQTDGFGNVSVLSNAVTIVVDTHADAPAAPVLDPASDSATAGDGLTRDNTPTLTGSAEANATVTLYDSDGSTVLGTATAGAGGAWSITSSALAAGAHDLSVRQVDAAGNASAAGPVLHLNIDDVALALAAPVLAPASDSGIAGDGITKAATPVFSGTAEALAQVTLYDGTTAVGSVKAGADGAWTITAAKLADGVHAITARQIDLAGNESAAGTAFGLTVDTTAPAAPAAPQLMAASDTGKLGDGLTENDIPVIEGTALANTLVTLYETVGKATVKLGTAMADAGGKWSIASTGMSLGVHTLSASQTDAAGNESAASSPFTLRIMAPPVPVSLIDGMPVNIQPISLPGNVQGTAVSIPVVDAGRTESSGQPGVADIPLAASNGATVLLAQLAPGYGLSASGASVPAASATELLIASIKAATPSHAPADQGHLTGNGQSFLAGLASSSALLVETVKPVSSAAPSGMLTLSGPAAGAGQSTALVIDAGGLAGGAAIALQNVNFAAVIGAATVTAGSSMVLSGDGASQHFTVAAGGAGSVFAGGGSDILGVAAIPAAGPAPAAGTALLHGGTADDTATFSGARADYNIEFHNGYVMVSNKATPGVKAMVVNVEQLQFSDTSIAVQNSADMGTLAGIYQTVLGRQADVMGIEYWANVHQAGASWGAIALNMIASSEHVTSHEGFNGVAAHDLALLYTAIFNRDADAGGMAYWTAAMGRGMTLEQVASSFVQSVEMVGHQRVATDWDFSVG